MGKPEDFLNEIEALSRRYGLCLGHEDGHGAFLVVPFDEYHIEWLKAASVRVRLHEKPKEDPFDATREGGNCA
jgi:hypothetical protein